MFIDFFIELRGAKVPVSLREYLTLLEGMDAGLAEYSVDDFYYLSRACLVKDEKNLDKFDRVFASVFKGLESPADGIEAEIPEEWLRKLAERFLTPEEMAEIEALGGWEKLMETLRQRLEEQRQRHQGGSKWIGTAGTSPFGAFGYNPEGVRIGQDKGRQGRAVKVWDRREYRNLDDTVELGTRNIKIALRRLRASPARAPRPSSTCPTPSAPRRTTATSTSAWCRSATNTVKVLLFLDIGGSMDPHVRALEELFSAARSEFKHLESFYFHNCLYEKVWRDNRRRHSEVTPTWEVLHTYAADYKVIWVGDAAMSPYEVTYAGGSVEHWNEEPGIVWMQRVLDIYGRSVWLNPVPEKWWEYTASTQMIRQLMGDRMYPLTIDGLDRAMRELSR